MEQVAISFIKLVLELHPVKTQSMEEGTEGFHHEQHPDSCENEDDDTHYKNYHIVVPVTQDRVFIRLSFFGLERARILILGNG